jgi:hypothetical protein
MRQPIMNGVVFTGSCDIEVEFNGCAVSNVLEGLVGIHGYIKVPTLNTDGSPVMINGQPLPNIMQGWVEAWRLVDPADGQFDGYLQDHGQENGNNLGAGEGNFDGLNDF